MMTNSVSESESGARRLDIRVRFWKIKMNSLFLAFRKAGASLAKYHLSLDHSFSCSLLGWLLLILQVSMGISSARSPDLSLNHPISAPPHHPQQAVSLRLSLHHGTERTIPGMVFEFLSHETVSFLWRKNHVYFGCTSRNLGEISNATKK